MVAGRGLVLLQELLSAAIPRHAVVLLLHFRALLQVTVVAYICQEACRLIAVVGCV